MGEEPERAKIRVPKTAWKTSLKDKRLVNISVNRVVWIGARVDQTFGILRTNLALLQALQSNCPVSECVAVDPVSAGGARRRPKEASALTYDVAASRLLRQPLLRCARFPGRHGVGFHDDVLAHKNPYSFTASNLSCPSVRHSTPGHEGKLLLPEWPIGEDGFDLSRADHCGVNLGLVPECDRWVC